MTGPGYSDRDQNYSDVPPDGFDELWNIEERWESQKWFKHHRRVLEDIDQESKPALNEDDLVRILEFNEKVDNEESFRCHCTYKYVNRVNDLSPSNPS